MSSAVRGPYAKSAAVRARIVDVCIEAFGTSGFRAATMAEIARRASISHTGLLHHFPRKEDLLVAVLEMGDRQAAEFLASVTEVDTMERPLEILDAMTDIFMENAGRSGLIELHAVLAGEATSPDHPAFGYFAHRFDNSRAFYGRLFARLRETGSLMSSAEPLMLADITLGVFEGVMTQWLYHRDTARLERTAREFIDSIIDRNPG